MTSQEFSDQFDVQYNNITSNQAPGLTEYEKSVFLTKAQDEKVKNNFSANSKGNTLGQGFDDSQKRQIDFSTLMKTGTPAVNAGVGNFDARTTGVAKVTLPSDIFMIVNEKVTVTRGTTTGVVLTVKPLSFGDYDLMMSKPYKRPLKSQAWRLISNTDDSTDLIVGPTDTVTGYSVRYIRRPRPIIVGDLDGLTIDGYQYGTNAAEAANPQTTPPTGPDYTSGCELNPILHQEILQRAVELAKVAWTATGQDNAQMILQAGQRSE